MILTIPDKTNDEIETHFNLTKEMLNLYTFFALDIADRINPETW